MPYVPLKNSFFAIPSATLATPATVHNQNSQSVATVATVAREVAKNENVSAISIASCEADDCAPETDPVFWQGVADERNAAAGARGGDDRYCGCQRVATGQGRNKSTGITTWVCDDCSEPPAAPVVVADRQRDAARRNRQAAKAGITDRWCGCGALATLAIGRVKPSAGNPDGVEHWLCDECFDSRKAA